VRGRQASQCHCIAICTPVATRWTELIPTGLADYQLVLSYHGINIIDPESWADWYNMYVYQNPYRLRTILVTAILPTDDIYSLVTRKMADKNLEVAQDRITRIIIVGHGTPGELGGLWAATKESSDFSTDKMRDPTSAHGRLLSYLFPFTNGKCDVELRACKQAIGEPGKEFMLEMSRSLGANVIGYDDDYSIRGWGDQYTAYRNGTFKLTKKGMPFRALWADVGYNAASVAAWASGFISGF
jgi:hypothetical protein